MSKRSNSEVGMKKDTHLTSTSVALNRRRFSLGLPLLAAGAAAPQEVVAAKAPSRDEAPIVTYYRTKTIDGIKIFYREAGPANAPVVLLLHGFPTSSHMFRNLIPELADRYHVIAPDYPGYGQSDMPDRATFSYTFDRFGELVDGLLDALGVKRYAMYVMDYGAPVGWRLALKHPERITALIVQNGNAYEEGLKEFWDPIKAYWSDHYKRDLPKVEFHLIDTGHFAFEDKADEMVPLIRDFLHRKIAS